MASEISARAGSGASIYNMVVGVSGNSASVTSFYRTGGVAPSSSTNPEIIITLDWVAATGVVFAPTFSAGNIAAQLIAPQFFAPSPAAGISQPLAQLPVHLIGHSRGGSLVSALARALGQQGLWVDQVTTLDPHPVASTGDPAVSTTNNVVFADNYYQTAGYISEGFITGSAVGGAQNVDLTSLGYGHSGVHDYYDNTIGGGTADGFAWSRIAASSRSSAGLMFSGASRAGLSVVASGASVWDNIQIDNLKTSTSVAQGGTLPLQTHFLDSNMDATLTLGFDANANPYDGTLSAGAVSTRNTTVSSFGTWNPSLATTSVAPGTYRAFAKITNGTRTRYYYAPGTVTITPETTSPTAVATASNVTVAGASNYTFTVAYSDNFAVNTSTIDGADIKVTGLGGFSQFAQLVSIDNGANGTPRTATYKITPPGGSWDLADNGTYTLALQAGQVADTSGNAASAATLKTFTVNIAGPVQDTTKPTATAVAANVTVAGASSYTFTVAYSDNVAVKRSTIDAADILVTGPNGFSQLASLVGIDLAGDGSPRTGTYKITPPGGSWDLADNGTYTLALRAAQITDTSNNTANAVTLKTFTVNIAPAGTTATISGTVFSDANANRVKDSGEIPLAATLYVDLDNDGIKESGEPWTTSSPRSGSYAFLNIAPGTFSVRAVAPAGYRQTLPKRYYSVSVSGGKTLSGIDFGFTTLAYVSGIVWNDLNANKAVDNAEGGLAGWRVFIDSNNDGKWQTTEQSVLSDAGGYVVFNALAPGQHTFRVVQQSGWIATSRTWQTVILGSGQIIQKMGFGQRR